MCSAIAAGGDAEWEFAWNQYLDTDLPGEKSSMLRALGCTDKVWLLIRYLEMSFTSGSGVRKQDANTVFYAITAKPLGQNIAWNYLRDNAEKIHKYLGSGYQLGGRLKAASGGFKSQLKLDEVRSFVKDSGDLLKDAGRHIREVEESIGHSISWMDKHYQTVTSWLRTEGHTTSLRSV